MLIIKNGNLALSTLGSVEKGDLYIRNGRISGIKLAGKVQGEIFASESAEVIDATGKLVAPGFVDLHVHFREPGFEAKETI